MNIRLNCRSPAVIGSFPAVFLLLLFFPVQSWSQELPEGIEVTVAAEYPVDIPGIEKVVLKRFTFQPGASLDLTVDETAFCNATQGTFVFVDHDLGITTVYEAGSRWAMPEKGTKITVSNPGNVPAVQWVYGLVEKE